MPAAYLIQGFVLAYESVINYVNSTLPEDEQFNDGSDMIDVEEHFNTHLSHASGSGMTLTFNARQQNFVLGFVIGGMEYAAGDSVIGQVGVERQLRIFRDFERACQTLNIIPPAPEAVILFIHVF